MGIAAAPVPAPSYAAQGTQPAQISGVESLPPTPPETTGGAAEARGAGFFLLVGMVTALVVVLVVRRCVARVRAEYWAATKVPPTSSGLDELAPEPEHQPERTPDSPHRWHDGVASGRLAAEAAAATRTTELSADSCFDSNSPHHPDNQRSEPAPVSEGEPKTGAGLQLVPEHTMSPTDTDGAGASPRQPRSPPRAAGATTGSPAPAADVSRPPTAGEALLPGSWTAQVSRSTGNTYYYNAATDESTYELPAGSTPVKQRPISSVSPPDTPRGAQRGVPSAAQPSLRRSPIRPRGMPPHQASFVL